MMIRAARHMSPERELSAVPVAPLRACVRGSLAQNEGGKHKQNAQNSFHRKQRGACLPAPCCLYAKREHVNTPAFKATRSRARSLRADSAGRWAAWRAFYTAPDHVFTLKTSLLCIRDVAEAERPLVSMYFMNASWLEGACG